MKELCPNLSNKQVKQQFDELVANVGENAAYVVWSENNGHAIDQAPNGEPSLLFQSLLSHYNGDRSAAVKARVKTFSKSFKTWFNGSSVVDKNGEPQSIDMLVGAGKFSSESPNIYKKQDDGMLNISDTVNSELFPSFRNLSNSREAIQQLFDKGLVPDELNELAKTMQKYHVPIHFVSKQSVNSNDVAEYDPLGGITVFPRAFDRDDLASTVIHEMTHFYTIGAMNNPQNEAERSFQQAMADAYKQYKHLDTLRGIYGFKDEFEFVSEIYSNLEFRSILRGGHKSIWNKIVSAIKRLFTADVTNKQSVDEIIKAIDQFVLYGNEHGVRLSTDRRQYMKMDDTLNEVEALHAKIIKGLKQRLKAIQRYAEDKNKAANEYTISKLLADITTADNKVAIVEFVQHLNNTLSNAVSFLAISPDKVNSKQLVQLKRDYIGYYKPMLRDISSLVETTDLLSDIPNYDLFIENVDNLVSKLNKIEVRYDRLLKIKTRSFLKEYATQSGSPLTNEMIAWLDNPNNDVGWMSYYMGMASNTDNEVVRIMENIIRNVSNNVNRNTRQVGERLIPLLAAAKKKHGGNVMQMLQEKDKDGKATGYLVRDRNYGQYYSERTAFFSSLATKYNLEVDERGLHILPEDEAIRRKYDKDVRDWLDQKAERMFTKEYYELKGNLLAETRDALDEVQDRIASLKSNYMIDGVFYNHRMSQREQIALKQLQRDKAALASEYNYDGSSKTGTALEIAKDLQKFKAAVGDNIQYKKQSSRFLVTAKKMFSILSQEEYAAWYNFNTHEDYTDQFWEDLSSIQKTEQSDAYKLLYERRKAIHRLYRKDNSLEIDADLIDDVTAQKLKELDAQIADNYVAPEKGSRKDGLKFKDVAEIALSDAYTKAYADAQAAGKKYFDEWYDRNHYTDAKGTSKPASIWTYLRPVNPKYIQGGIPNAMFAEVDESSRFFNKNFNPTGEYTQPKRSLYNNEASFKAITGSPELKALYDAVLQTMKDSASRIGFMQNTNPYKLPQMTARTFQMISRESNVLKGLKYAAVDSLGIKDDDSDYVAEYELSPDNTPIKNIPTRYLKMLDNPSMITADVVGSVIEFFNMADSFKEMSAVQDDLEMILNRLSQLEVTGKKGKTPGELNVFKKAQQLLDMNLYGQKKNRQEFSLFGKTVEISKPLSMLYGYTTKVNLAFNIWAMGTNYVTGQGYTDMEAILGRYYDTNDVAFAKAELFRNMPQNVTNIGNVNVKNKLLSLMQLNQVTRSNEETYNRLDNSAALRALNQHFWFNGYTAGDFVVKSQVLGAIYHSYRLHDGKFMNKTEFLNTYYPGDRKAGLVKFNNLKTTLYDAYDQNGEITPEYAGVITKKLQNMITNKINTLAQKIDGNLSDSDRSAIHANTYTQFLVMHRNFMIVGIQDRFKKKQFNYNTGEVEEGMYRSVGRFIASQISTGRLFAIKQLLADFNNLEDYEKYNVKKALLEMANFLALAMAVSFLLVPLADSGDGEDEWFLQASTYLAMRAAFEFRTLYNPFELQALLNSPSAAFNTFEYMTGMIGLIWLPNHFAGGVWEAIDRGAYKGMPKVLRNFIKFTPAKNIIEAADPKPKRSYLQNQLMM